MHLDLLSVLECPLHRSSLDLLDVMVSGDNAIDGRLRCRMGDVFPIRAGVPRFVDEPRTLRNVRSFGDEWNFFNFLDFKINWDNHLVKHTFGSADVFRGKV